MVMSQQNMRMQRHLALTLINLLQKKPLEKITAADLAEAGQVNRSTFYRYFHNKFDLLSDALSESLWQSFETTENMTADDLIDGLVEWVNNNRRVIKNILMNNTSFNFYQEIIHELTAMLDKQDDCDFVLDFVAIPLESAPNPAFAKEAFASSIVGMLMTWLNHPEIDETDFKAFLKAGLAVKGPIISNW
ncbi:TetR/AcrR family transcriptional regulator [Furfurilactobacillus curtus]|uniref:TetR family transcriptional regulator n=1 Tax=Furfurilactobacillus curtus TaxID=1746200 RepID=A0ABQ5JP76_9LACO